MVERTPGEGEAGPASRWNPAQYERFRKERSQPFYDLAALVERGPGMRVIDLGCGTGELTAWLHDELDAASTFGVDASETMLAKAAPRAFESPLGGLRFQRADVATLDATAAPGAPYDLVFSNAALQWVLDHKALFPRLAGLVAPGGQLAVQMPTNGDHPSQRLAHAIAQEPPFAEALEGYVRPDPVRAPEWYAALLHELGFVEQRVRLHVYPHLLPETRQAVEWVKGSLLTPYEARMPAPLYERFVAEYERRLLAEVGDQRPYFYTFKRVLLWGRRSSA